jgi:hypothetical protein
MQLFEIWTREQQVANREQLSVCHALNRSDPPIR